MPKMNLLLDSNVVIDLLNEREPYYKDARLLAIVGKCEHYDLWITVSQFTDIIYVLTDGGKPSLKDSVQRKLQALRTFVKIHPVGSEEIDCVLSSDWKDLEDALLAQSAIHLGVDAIITRNKKDFTKSVIPAMDCRDFFEHMKNTHGIEYDFSLIE